MSSRSNPGRVYNRRVTRHIERLLPEQSLSRSDFTFSGEAIIDRENNPGKPPGGRCTVKCYVGEDGQFTILEKSRLRTDGEILWACWNRIRRTHAVDAPELSPFQYHVQTQILSRGDRKRGETLVSLEELEKMPVHGGREAQAAVLLAERLAVEKAVAPGGRSDICCSLHALPSLPRVIDRGKVIDLSWKEIDALIGPDSEMIAASVDIEPVNDEERQEAIQKGIDLLDDDSATSAERADERRARAEAKKHDRRRDRPRDDRSATAEDERISEELPEDLSPEEAEKKLHEMREEIDEMREEE